MVFIKILFDIQTVNVKNRRLSTKISKINALKLDKKGELIEELNLEINPPHSGINDMDLLKDSVKWCVEERDYAEDIKNSIMLLEEFIEESRVIYVWGNYHIWQVKQECMIHGLNSDFLDNSVDIKKAFLNMHSMPSGNISDVIEYYEIELNTDKDISCSMQNIYNIYNHILNNDESLEFCNSCARGHHLMVSIEDKIEIPKMCKRCLVYKHKPKFKDIQ